MPAKSLSHISRHLDVRHRAHISQPLLCILSQIHRIQPSPPITLRCALILWVNLLLILLILSLPFKPSTTNLRAFLTLPLCLPLCKNLKKVVFFLLGDSPGTLCLFHLHRQVCVKKSGFEKFWDIDMGKGLARTQTPFIPAHL